MERDYRPGFGWQSLGLGAIVVVVASVVLMPADVLDRITHAPPRVGLLRPDVLIVSGSAPDQAAVSQTAQPRGYTVRVAASLESGLASLQREPARIGFVLIDGSLAGAKRMISAAKTTCPDARVIVLSGERDAGEISSLLVNAGMN